MLSVKTIILVTFGLCMLINKVVSSKKVICYYTNWAQYRPEGVKYFPENIDPNLCTHVIYSFAKLTSASELAAYEWNDESEWNKGMYERAIDMKAQNPNLKILIAVGGWNHGSGPFSDMVTDVKLRQKFVSTSVTFLKKHKFDGLDLDWEYPASRSGSRPSDKQLFTSLVKELKEAFASYGFLLSAAVSAGKSTIDLAYDVAQISNDLDFINLMSYDLHGSWESFVGFNAPLYSNDELSVDYAVKYWISLGASPEKLMLGMGTYGRSFRLCGSSSTPGSCAAGGATAGKYTREAGFMSYYEICENIKVNGWTEAYDENAQVPYAYKGDQWVGYDNVKSIQLKTQYALAQNLGGIMFWALDLDDFVGKFCGEGKYPLIVAAVSALGDNVSLTVPPTITTIQSTTVTGSPYTGPTVTITLTTQSTTTASLTTTASTTTSTATTTTITTTTTTTGPPRTARCFKGDGYYPVVENECKSFYQCVYSGTEWETAIDFNCPSPLVFDMNLYICNWADAVTCAN